MPLDALALEVGKAKMARSVAAPPALSKRHPSLHGLSQRRHRAELTRLMQMENNSTEFQEGWLLAL